MPDGLSGHNRDEAILWRAVIDQSLCDVLTKSTADEEIKAAADALEWVNATPNDPPKLVVCEDFDGQPLEFLVCLHEEFEEVCHRANLPPDYVRTTWHRLYNHIKKRKAT